MISLFKTTRFQSPKLWAWRFPINFYMGIWGFMIDYRSTDTEKKDTMELWTKVQKRENNAVLVCNNSDWKVL